jgi:hypothetical protein
LPDNPRSLHVPGCASKLDRDANGPPCRPRPARNDRIYPDRASGKAYLQGLAKPDPETGERIIVFRATEGFEPPPMELAEAGAPE